MSAVIASPAFIRREPTESAPVLFEIPRSGRQYPGNFRSIASLEDLQKSVSMYAEDCYLKVLEEGATWMFAPCANTFVDLNRHALDIDPDQLSEPWKGELQPSPMCLRGSGLIPMMCARTKPIYDRKLSVVDIEDRLNHYYWPYHNEVSQVLANLQRQFGAAIHLSCHSMPDIVAIGPDAGSQRSDFDLGDRNGTTCSPAVTEAVAKVLRERGYSVTINTYFIGAEAVRKHGNPEGGIHSLQIEMNRKLFMDEELRIPIDRMAVVQSDMQLVARRLADLSRELVK